jgi:hypothetical protein
MEILFVKPIFNISRKWPGDGDYLFISSLSDGLEALLQSILSGQ